jgi:serine/threonine protein kinase/Tol biopolymer transport system component
MSLAPGTKLGPYEILAPLGAGGMGEVYRARDTRLERTVAIKVLPEHLSATADLKQRFEREARAISSLNHPHICILYDIGEQDGVDFLVMEHMEGETLAARLERGALPAAETLRYASEIADALDKAHRQGLIHRDLKPGNVMLTKAGAKLLDFGLARIVGAAATAPAGSGSLPGAAMLSQHPTVATPLTGAGMIVGTFQYMAPEQLDGGEADARSDIWAFGATVYEMATGRKAFTGHSQASLIASILKEQPRPIAEIEPLTPPGLDRIVQRCLAKDPDERWQSARDLAHELKWIAQGGSQAGVPAPVAAKRRQRERGMLITAGVLGAATVGLAIAMWLRTPPPPQVVRFDIRPPSTIQFQDAPRISPNGEYLAYSGTDSTGTTRIWVRNMSGMTAEPLPGTEGIVQRPFWSPDSRYLGFFAGGKLKKVAVGGGPAITVADAPNGSDGAWSREGVILFDGSTGDPIRRVAAAGGVPAPAFLPDTAKRESVGWPFFLPDGKHFIYQEITTRSLCVGTIGSSKTRVLGSADSRIEYSPQGYVLYARGGSLVAQPFDAGALKLTGEPFPVAEPLRTQPNGGADFSVSNTGTLVYSAGSTQEAELVWVDRSGREQGTVQMGTLTNFLSPALSPDGHRVAFRVQDAQSRTRDVWLADMVRGVQSRFTFDPGNENHPTWAPDGSKIAYWSDDEKNPGIYVKSSSGAGDAELLMKSKDETVITDWSRDGKTIVYALQPPTTKSEVWTVAAEGEHAANVFLRGPFDYLDGRLSPDGRWLSYTSSESGRPEVYVQTFPAHSGKWQISTSGGSDARWNANGKELVYLAADQRLMSVPIRTAPSFEADVPAPLFTARVLFPGVALRTHYEMSTDGQRFLMCAPRGAQSLSGANVVLNWFVEARRR